VISIPASSSFRLRTDVPRTELSASPEVEAFLAALHHPRKAEILAVREIIRGADPRIGEGIKWNAPSFRTSEWFATLHLRAKDGVQVVLHFGAKKRAGFAPRTAIADPDGLLEWAGEDRAFARFRDLAEVQAKQPAFAAVLRQWIEHV
jgi:hypothetical protein